LSLAQVDASILPTKPANYEKRLLSSDKISDKKINPVKKSLENLSSRYNFYFNAENKLNGIIDAATAQNKDNYTSLLSFFPYNLEQISGNKTELDSVIFKANNAILLHDLRSDWVDDFFLLMGKAYFFKRDFDSAAIAFQYINYTFQPKSKDEKGYNKTIGSNLNTSGNVFTISTLEPQNPLVQLVAHISARNEAILWLIRNYIEQHDFFNAASLIETLARDKNFPKRLIPQLQELQAYQFYLQENFDSSANYLAKTIKSYPKSEKARAAFLTAQLFEKAGNFPKAIQNYKVAIESTNDPILEAYARVNQIQLFQGEEGEKNAKENLKVLLKMAKMDKYEDYRAMIYHAAAKIEYFSNHFNETIQLSQKGTTFNRTDIHYRDINFHLLADVAFTQLKYELAANAYDSLDLTDTAIHDVETIKERKVILKKLTALLTTKKIQDSLLRIEAMPEKEREIFLKAQAKKLKKAKGLKETENTGLDAGYGESSVVAASGLAEKPINLFAGNESKGEWYFYNNTLKTQGNKQFKTVWGNRPNLDNWRRIKAIAQTIAAQKASGDFMPTPGQDNFNDAIPETDTVAEPIVASKDTLLITLYKLSKIYREELNDCISLTGNNEELLNQFPSSLYTEEIVFGLYNCYKTAENKEKAAFYKKYLDEHFPQSKFFRLANNPQSVAKEKNAMKNAATASYEKIYSTFLEGDFAKAFAEKKKSDTLYGESFWTPQLLYIEAIYHIKNKNDSIAINILEKIISLFPASILSGKSATLIKALKDRTTTEAYLQNLQINKAGTDSIVTKQKQSEIIKITDTAKMVKVQPSIVIPTKKGIIQTDTTASKPLIVIPTNNFGYTSNTNDEYLFIINLEKVDKVYISEAKNAINRYNSQHYYNETLTISSVSLTQTTELIIISAFKNAISANEYLEKTKLAALNEIFPWMPKEKCSFFIISTPNLEILKKSNDEPQYLEWLKQHPIGK
jgi:outer membrane protein assembly factor BamD (BamD/ComL family)